MHLEVGAVSQTVEVSISSTAALINTQDASLGNVLESNQITQLPLEGRNLGDLLSLQPGATREGYVTGARADQSNVTLDGVDINNAQSGNAALAHGQHDGRRPGYGKSEHYDGTRAATERRSSGRISRDYRQRQRQSGSFGWRAN